MPNLANHINDFKVGGYARVLDNNFSRYSDLEIGSVHRVTAVNIFDPDIQSGSIAIEGDSGGPHDGGAYGHLLFEAVDAPEDDGLDADNLTGMDLGEGDEPYNPYPVGTRVIVTDSRTPIGGFAIGSGLSRFVGATGTVSWSEPNNCRVDFDNPDLDSVGTWSHDALQRIVQAIPADADVMTEKEEELERRIAELSESRDNALKHAEGLETQLAEARSEIDAHKARGDEAWVAFAEADRARIVAEGTLDYVMKSLSPTLLAEARGFRDGMITALNDD